MSNVHEIAMTQEKRAHAIHGVSFYMFFLDSVIGLIECCSIVASIWKFYTGSDHVITSKVFNTLMQRISSTSACNVHENLNDFWKDCACNTIIG